MINLKDIEARYKINPEPIEVKRTRELIRESFSDLKFLEETHQYFVGDQEYPPVSNVCHRFEPYVDWDSIAERKAKKLGKTKEELQKEWHENNITSTHCGSKTHWFGEQMMNLFIGESVDLPFQYTSDNYIIPYCGKEKAIEMYWQDILNNPYVYPVMPEAKIYNKSLGYAGTFDILQAYRLKNNEIVFSIHDYKGLPLETPILTSTGWKVIGDLEEGDIIFDGKNNETKILHLSEIHYNPCFRIVFDSGYSIVADHEHRWLLCDGRIVETSELCYGDYIPKLGSSLQVIKLERVPTIPTRCLEVDSPEHTFLVDHELLVTHNTNKSLKNDFNRRESNRLLEPFQDFIDEPFSIYSIQLSLYQLGLEQLGIKIVDRNLIWLKEDGKYEKFSTPDLTQRLLKTL
jgi:hypothetical protein